MLRKIQKEICCWLWGHHKSFFCCQNLHTYFYCEELVVKALGHVSKSSSCVPKSNANGFTCHPFIGGQNHRVIGDASFGFLCYNFFWLMDVRIWTWHICSCHYFHKLIVGTLPCDSGTFLKPLIWLDLQWQSAYCLCKGWGWQYVHFCTNSNFNGWICFFGT